MFDCGKNNKQHDHITQTRAEDARACSHAPAPLLPAHRHLRCTSASKASMSNCSPPSPAVAGSATETSRLCAAKGVRAPGRVTAGAERPRSTGTRGYGAKQPTAGAPRSRTAAASIARRALCSRAPPPIDGSHQKEVTGRGRDLATSIAVWQATAQASAAQPPGAVDPLDDGDRRGSGAAASGARRVEACRVAGASCRAPLRSCRRPAARAPAREHAR